MSSFMLDERVRLSIEFALTSSVHDPLLVQQQEAAARRLGMSGAEIDAARSGWSFDVRTSMAVALAIASATFDVEGHQQHRTKALKAGITEEGCVEIEALAERLAKPGFRRGGRYG
jgi:hypothetical protein